MNMGRDDEPLLPDNFPVDNIPKSSAKKHFSGSHATQRKYNNT